MKNLILTLIITLPLTIWGQGWEKIYGGMYDESGQNCKETDDGGFIIVGYTNSFGSSAQQWSPLFGQYDVYMIKTDENGNEQWTNTFGEEGNQIGHSVQQTIDGGYILCGINYSSENQTNGWLIKTDENGNEQWSQVFQENCRSVQQTTDGGYILVGDSSLIKTDENGNIQWNQIFIDTYLRDVQKTLDGGFIVTGSLNESNNPMFNEVIFDIFLLKTNENGTEEWSKTFGGIWDDYGYSVQQTIDGGYIISGLSFSFSNNIDDNGWLIKTDENGNEQWNQVFQNGGNSVKQTSDEGFIFLGTSSLIKTDENGNEQWINNIESLFSIEGFNIETVTNGGFVFCGRKQHSYLEDEFPDGNHNVFLFKTDEYGNTLPYIEPLSGCDSVQSIVNDTYFYESGEYIDTLTNIYGGDSVVVQNVTIYTSPSSTYIGGEDTVILGSNPQFGFMTTNLNNTYELFVENGFGNFVQMCSDSYDINVTWNEVGAGSIILIETEPNSNCTDTIIYLVEVIPPTSFYDIEIYGCDSVQSIVNDTYFYESGEYFDTLTNIYGGDSVVIQNVILESTQSSINIEDEIFLDFVNGQFISYNNYIINNFNYNHTYQVVIEGGSIEDIGILQEFGNFNVLWNNSGNATLTLIESSITGCSTDTIIYEINTILNIPNTSHIYDVFICDSVQSIVNDTYFYESGEYIDTLTNIYGGDSVIIQNINIYLSPELIQINGNNIVSNSSLEFYQTTNETDNILEWNITGGSIYENQNNIIQVLWGNEGIGYVEVTETDTNGCSTTSILEVTISNDFTFNCIEGTCIEVNDGTGTYTSFEGCQEFCNATSITDFNNSNKKLKKITNLLGQETPIRKNSPLLYIYDDGTVEKKVIIE